MDFIVGMLAAAMLLFGSINTIATKLQVRGLGQLEIYSFLHFSEEESTDATPR